MCDRLDFFHARFSCEGADLFHEYHWSESGHEIVSVRSPYHDAELLQLLQNSVPAVQLDGPQLTATASGEPLPHVGRQQSGHAAPWLIGGRSPYAACAASR
jgi:hypothetical protein